MATIEFNSFSSKLMYHTTLFRNKPGFSSKVAAEVGYAAIAMVSVAETTTAFAISMLSLLVFPLSSTPYFRSSKWLNSSAFAIKWSIGDFFCNFCLLFDANSKMAADESSARQIFKTKNFMKLPLGAIT